MGRPICRVLACIVCILLVPPAWGAAGSLRLGAAVSVALPRGFTLGGGGEIRWASYRGIWWPPTRDRSSRRDRAISLNASVHNRGFTVLGFSPELVLVKEKRTSNAQLSDYRRIRGELRFVRQF